MNGHFIMKQRTHPSNHYWTGGFSQVVCYLVQHIILLQLETEFQCTRHLTSLRSTTHTVQSSPGLNWKPNCILGLGRIF